MASVPQIYETVSMLEIDRIIRSVDALDEEVDKAMQLAIAATAKMAQRLSNAKMSEEVAMDVTAARRRIMAIKRSAGKYHRGGKMKRARTRDLRRRGAIWFGLDPLDPIKDFSPSVRQSAIVNRAPLVTGKNEQMPNSFMGHDKGGNVRVFHRKGPKRLPIKRTRIDYKARAINLIAGEIWPQVERFFYGSLRYNLARVIEESQ